MKHYRSQQDPNEGKESVTNQVIIDLEMRRKLGIKKYGTELKTFNGRNPLIDAYQEALDLCCYLKQKLMEQEQSISDFIDNEIHDNDYDKLNINPHLKKEK
jgi:hypothetical protein